MTSKVIDLMNEDEYILVDIFVLSVKLVSIDKILEEK